MSPKGLSFEKKIGQGQRVPSDMAGKMCTKATKEISNKTSQKAGPVNIVGEMRERGKGRSRNEVKYFPSRVPELSISKGRARGGDTKIEIFVTSSEVSSLARATSERKDIVTD